MIEVRFRGKRDKWGNIHSYRFGTKRMHILRNALREYGIETRYNTRADFREARQYDGPWLEMPTQLMSKIRHAIEDDYGILQKQGWPRPFKLTASDFKSMMEAIDYDNMVDPFIEWLENLPPWKGDNLIDHMLVNLFNEHRDAPADSLTSTFGLWASRFPFIAAVQLAYFYDSQAPRDVIRTRPLFVGGKGIGKSSMLKNLLPPDYPEWYNGGFIVANDPLRMVEQTNAVVICECAELAGMTERNIDVWKAFATNRRNRTRMKYRPNVRSYPQRAVIIGTTNRTRFIPLGEDGWQRDLPVLLGHAPRAVERWLHDNREQCWAEALARVKNGERAKLPQELVGVATKHSEQFRKRNDPLEDAVGRLPVEFDKKTTTDLLLEARVVTSEEDAVHLHPRSQAYFVDRLYAAGCKSIEWTDEEGRTQYGWMRIPKPDKPQP